MLPHKYRLAWDKKIIRARPTFFVCHHAVTDHQKCCKPKILGNSPSSFLWLQSYRSLFHKFLVRYINGEAGSISKKDLANMIRKRRKIGDDLPPVYPNGWFRLLDSHQLRPGEVKEVCAMGKIFFLEFRNL